MSEFTMPSLGADMDEGTVMEWLVKPGDEVHHGDIVAVVDTAKAAVEVECFTDGTVETLLVPPGRTVPVGTPLAVITTAGAAAGRPRRAAPAPAGRSHVVSPLVRHLAEEKGIDLSSVQGTGHAGTITRADIERAATAMPSPPPPPASPLPPAPATRVPQPPARPQASPLARRLARELDVDLRDVAGTGPHGTIHGEDVRHAAEGKATPRRVTRKAPTREPAPEPVREPTRRTAADRQAAMRQTIGRLMTRSKREIPHYYLATTINVATALDWLRERNRERAISDRLVPAALLLKATALAAREFPQLNGYWIDDRFEPGEAVHLGIAISLRGGGLVAPALRGAAELELTEVMTGLRDLVARARGGRLRGGELTDATITVTNLGDQGVESVTGVIYPPQVALVGFGTIAERPWAINGMLGVRPLVTATLAADHRATDGYLGARFLDAITGLLQRPEQL